MKKLNLILLLIFAIITSSCEDIENLNLGEDNPWVQFDSSVFSVSENSSTPLMIPVLYASESNDGGVDVNFTYTANTNDGFTVSPANGVLNIPSGEFIGYIEILPINDSEENDNIVLDFDLSNNSISQGIGGEGVYKHTAQITIVEDDCSFTLEQLGDAVWSGFDNVPGGEAGPNSSMITSSYDGTNLLLEGISYAWLTNTDYWDEVVVISSPVITQVDLVTGAVTIDLQYLCSTTWLGNPQPDYSIQATGTYLPCSQTMTIDYDLIQGGGILRSYTETITF